MKKLFLVLVLMLTVSFAFASTTNESVKLEIKTISASEIAVNKIAFTKIQDFDSSFFQIINLTGRCTITISAYNQDGELVSQVNLYYETIDAIHCAQLARAFRNYLN